MVELDPDGLQPAENKRIIQSAVTPRPIAWISTVGQDGVENIAPFSSYNYFSTGSREGASPIVLFNSPNETVGLKDTAKNALETEEFVVNVVTEELIREMDESSEPIPADESEFTYADITPAPSTKVTPPRVSEAKIAMECELLDEIRYDRKLMILGEVVYYHVSEDIMEDGKVQMERLATVGRLGGPYYTSSSPHDFERQFR